MGKLEGKVAIITGGGKGIGFGLAKAFAKEGANLTITGRTMSRLEAAKEKLEAEYGVKVLPITADGADEASVANVVKQTVETFGHIDTVVNNAQVSKSGVMLKDHTKEDFDLAIYSGLYATFFYMRDAYPYLKESKGSVINFASGAGLFGKLGQSSYAAAKEGIRGLSRVAAAEWGPDGRSRERGLPAGDDGESGTVARRVSGSVCQDDSGDSAGALCRSGEGYRPRLRVPRVGRRRPMSRAKPSRSGRQRSASVRKGKIIQRETEEIPLPFFF